jgi:hypothetical protein
MNDSVRVLKKILAPSCDAETFASCGEPLELAINLLREAQKCRKIRQRLLDAAGVDIAVSPQVFSKLLDIREIDTVENTNRSLEVETLSLKTSRAADAPVSIGNLNTVLRELYRDLDRIRQMAAKHCLLLAGDISAEALENIPRWISDIRSLNWRASGYLFTGWRARMVESEFRAAFPRSEKAHPLRNAWPLVERELEVYRDCLGLNVKWAALGIDLFRILRADGLGNVNENLEAAGNALWNLVYNSPKVQKSLKLAGVDFGDVRTLFENERIL